MKKALVAAAVLALWCAPALAQSGSTNVEVVVNADLYNSGEISAALTRYLSDITIQGYNPTLTTIVFANAEDLRSHLATRYSTDGLAGVVFIGDMPSARFEDSWGPDGYYCDLFFQDLDGIWTDTGGHAGIYDGHVAGSGDVGPEIWFGRMNTASLAGLHPGRSEASLLNKYFDRNHAYRLGQHALAKNGLAYIDDDWEYYAVTWGAALDASVSGQTTIVSDPTTTVPTDWKAHLQQEWESVLLACHANKHTDGYGFDKHGNDNSQIKMYYSSEIEGDNPKVLFWNLFVCTAAVWTADGYTAGEYVYGGDYSLLAVASSKTGGMLEFEDYYTPLGDGATFGEAMQDWWNDRAADGFSIDEQLWHYGMTFVGDPLLVGQDYIPEPATLSLLALGGAALIRRKRK